MIRPLTIVTFLMACGSGLYLYQSKHAAQVLDRNIEKAVRETNALREQSKLLSAEWTMLNDPETLRKFSDQYLQLKSIAPTQFTSLGDLKARLPPVQIMTPTATPADTTDQEEEGPAVAEGTRPEPQMPPAVAATSAALPPVAAKEPKPPAAPAAVVAATRLPSAASVDRPAERPAERSADRPTDRVVDRSADRTTDRPADRKQVVLAKPAAVPSPRPPEPRLAESRPAEPHQNSAAPAVVRSVVATAPPVPVSRPAVIAAAAPPARPAPVAAPAYIPAAAAAPAPVAAQPQYTGSLLGMARTGSPPAPVPRPMPVSTAQWTTAN